MKELRPEQLAQQLNRGPLAPVYLLAGPEALLVLEAADTVRGKAREAGFTEREVLHVEASFDWNQLAQVGNSLSLFAERRIIELHLPEKGPGKNGSKALTEYIKQLNNDTLLLVIAPLTAATIRKSAWYKKLSVAGAAMFAWPIERRQLPSWIRQRARGCNLQLSTDATELLAGLTEGNLLACAQEIDRLALLYGSQQINADDVAAAAGDQARFGIFDLPAKALDGDAAGALRSLERLRQEGVDDVPILWALVRETRLLYRAANAARVGKVDALLQSMFMPPKRKRQIAQVARRANPDTLATLLRHGARADRILKGAQPGRGHDELITLTLGLAGIAPREPVIDPDHHHF